MILTAVTLYLLVLISLTAVVESMTVKWAAYIAYSVWWVIAVGLPLYGLSLLA